MMFDTTRVDGMSVNSNGWSCATCGGMIWQGLIHTCPGLPFASAPTPLYTIQRCPICDGRGNVPVGFYGRLTVATETSPEECRACDGKGLLRVGMLGTVEKLP